MLFCCAQNPACAAYTWYGYHYIYYWEYTCVGRSDLYDILSYDDYGTAGVRTDIGGNNEGKRALIQSFRLKGHFNCIIMSPCSVWPTV